MNTLPEIGSFTPLIVCGLPRAGTRMIADVLKQHPEICLQSEIPHTIMDELFQLANRIRDTYASHRDPSRLNRWLEKQEQFMAAAWLMVGKGPAVYPSRDVKYFGYKAPGHERFFTQYESFFGDHAPYYVFCTRNVADCWRSRKNISPKWGKNSDLGKFRKQYIRAHKNLAQMENEAPNRVLVFDLDEFKQAGDQLQYLRENFFDPLSLSTDEALSRTILALPNQNSSKRHGVSTAIDQETYDEMESLRHDEQIKRIKKQYA